MSKLSLKSIKKNDLKKCWDILPLVSRSFSLCIKLLPRPIDEQMMLAYMIYRVIDTIEDSSAPLKVKRDQFNQYINLISRPRFNKKLTLKVQESMLNLLDYSYEKPLLENQVALTRTYYSTSIKARKSILKWGKIMADGMYDFQKKSINTFADQDQYSYYVAGVVGYLLNDLFYHNKVITAKMHKKLKEHSKSFGLALQKVNILRDISKDIPSKRYYWPLSTLSKHKLSYETLLKDENRERAMAVLSEEIDNALKYLYSAMYYVVSLPNTAIRVRMFCLIPLFMAIESFAKCVNNTDIFNGKQTVKISRVQVHEIVAKSQLWGSSNEKLLRWFFNSTGRKIDSKIIAPELLLEKK